MSEPTANPTFLARHRVLVKACIHLVVFAFSLLTAFALAYNFRQITRWLPEFYFPLLGLLLPIKMIVFWRSGQFRSSWRYVGVRDLIGVCVASYVATFIFVAAFFVIENVWANMHGGVPFFTRDTSLAMPQSMFLLDLAATVVLVSAIRIGARLYYEETRQVAGESQTRLLVVGGGDTGETVLREVLRGPVRRHEVVGYLDDDPSRQGGRIHGVDVLGTTREIKSVCEKYDVEELLIALPTATPKELRAVVEQCEGANLRFHIVPPMADLIEGRVRVSQMRNVDIEDLLGRDPVQLDTAAIGDELKGKHILVTGAGGSIGSEMCRQIARFGPGSLILFEQAENNLFVINNELRRSFPDLETVPVVGDVCDKGRVRAVLAKYRPVAVFHAAAHKHVPMMEFNPGEAIKNNVLGSKTVADAAVECKVAKMVMISTDKAVNPTSIMGCSKRVAEMYCQELSHRGSTQFVTVRFGNVLGSSGSVVPIFKEQIARGGPVTVTHADMTRYFMTIPEAAQLVLQAGTMGHGGEIFVLDMGEPVKILDLAKEMITLSGLRPYEDIDIVITGMRPGEKLFEELSIEGEDISRTSHPKIGIWRTRREDWDQINAGICKLLEHADYAARSEIQAMLKTLVPEFVPSNTSIASS